MVSVHRLIIALVAIFTGSAAMAGGSRYGENCASPMVVYRTMAEVRAGTPVGTLCKERLENYQARFTLTIPAEDLLLSTRVGSAICFGAGTVGGCSWQPEGTFNQVAISESTSRHCSEQNTEMSISTVVFVQESRSRQHNQLQSVFAVSTTQTPCGRGPYAPLPRN